MGRKLSKGILLIQKFAEKYTNAILQKLNITSKKTIDKKKKTKRKNKNVKKNKICEIIENNKKKNEEYKEQKKKKLDDYLMNQEKELDFQQNYSFCNKIFFNEKDNFFCSSDEEKITNILDTDLLIKGEENNEEQNGSFCTGNETSSLNPFQFKFHLENDRNKDENLFLFQNDDQIDKQKKQKLLYNEKETDRKFGELELNPESYYLDIAEKENNKFSRNSKFTEETNKIYENKAFSNNNIFYGANTLEENRRQDLEKNKTKRKTELDINFEKNKKVEVLVSKNCLNDIEKNTYSEHEKLNQMTTNNVVNSTHNISNDNQSSFKINETSEQKAKKETNDNQNICNLPNMKYNLVFGNCTFEKLKDTHKKNGFQQEKVKLQQQEAEKENREHINKNNETQLKDHEKEENVHIENQHIQVSHNNRSDIYNLNNAHVINNVENQNFNSSTIMDNEYIFENEWIIHKVNKNKETLIHKNITNETFFQQGTNENLSHKSNIIRNIENELENNTSKSVDVNQEPFIKEYKDDYDLFDDLNGDNSFDIFFNDLQDPPSIFKM